MNELSGINVPIKNGFLGKLGVEYTPRKTSHMTYLGCNKG